MKFLVSSIVMKKIFDILLLSLVTLCSCSQVTKKEVQDNNTKIEINTRVVNKKEFSIIDRQMILLDNSDNQSLFSSIAKLQMKDGYIYILSDRGIPVIYMFDNSGKFVRTIGKTGNGPGEYGRIRDFNVKGNRIYIYDDRMRRLVSYLIHTGEHLSTSKTPFFARAFSLLNNGDFLFVLPKSQEHKKVVVTDSAYNIKNEWIDFDKDDLDNRSRASLLQENSSVISYVQAGSNTLYLFSKENGEFVQQYNLVFDGQAGKREDGDFILSSTPLMLPNVLFGNLHRENKLYVYSVSKYLSDYTSSVSEIQEGKMNVENILMPISLMNDSTVISYVNDEALAFLSEKNSGLSEECKEHLKHGGFALYLYTIK